MNLRVNPRLMLSICVFLKVLNKAYPGNRIFSPFALGTVMAIVKAGARGSTASVIRSAMKFPSDDETLNQGTKDLLAELKVKSGKILTPFKEFTSYSSYYRHKKVITSWKL
jgi:hypothetical protein